MGRRCVRDVKHWGVFWVNLLVGWTVIGWIVALVMALRAQRLSVSRRLILGMAWPVRLRGVTVVP